jgi:hypothetical protein
MRHKLTVDEREIRSAARWKIIQTANQFLMGFHAQHLHIPKLLGMKNLHRAVYICRQNMLVQGKVFIEAGFNPPVVKPGVPGILKKLLGR